MYVEKAEYSALIRSDRNFEWEALKGDILTRRKVYIVIFAIGVLLALAYMYLAYRWWYSLSSVLYIALGIWWLLVYPAVILGIKLKPKEYRITARGVWMNGNLITWKNFRCYEKRGRLLHLVSSSSLITLPSEVEDVVSRYLPACGQD